MYLYYKLSLFPAISTFSFLLWELHNSLVIDNWGEATFSSISPTYIYIHISYMIYVYIYSASIKHKSPKAFFHYCPPYSPSYRPLSVCFLFRTSDSYSQAGSTTLIRLWILWESHLRNYLLIEEELLSLSLSVYQHLLILFTFPFLKM